MTAPKHQPPNLWAWFLVGFVVTAVTAAAVLANTDPTPCVSPTPVVIVTTTFPPTSSTWPHVPMSVGG